MKTSSTPARHPRVKSWLVAISIIFLCNPTVRLFDIFPDFISCFIIAHYLDYSSLRAPFFKEARNAFLRLGVISIFRIPAFLIATGVRSGNVSDYDIIALLTFTFALLEGIYMISAIENLFSGLFYLGERSDALSLISPFIISGKKKRVRTQTPENLRAFSTFAVIYKLSVWAAPELLLLTQGVDHSSHATTIFRPAALYPYAILLSVISSFAVLLIFGRRFFAYYKAIRAEGKFFSATDSLITEEREVELKAKITKRDINSAFSLITAATVFSLVLRFDNLRDINIMPLVLFGVFIISALIKMSKYSYLPKFTVTLGVLFSCASLIFQITEGAFLDKYTYEMLIKDKAARADYIPVIITSGILCALFILFIIFLSHFIMKFSNIHTGFAEEGQIDEKYMKMHKKYMRNRILCFGIAGALVAPVRFLDCLFRYFPNMKIVAVEDGFGNVTFSLVPWFGVAVFVSTVLFFIISAYLSSVFRDELELKYSENF